MKTCVLSTHHHHLHLHFLHLLLLHLGHLPHRHLHPQWLLHLHIALPLVLLFHLVPHFLLHLILQQLIDSIKPIKMVIDQPLVCSYLGADDFEIATENYDSINY